eukprot:TRINITY_DN2649_c1_g2_i1.p2 TRINITY_DN2649_c1_g2~~TRINITY_DN2649_c1_g2_i1.p2  ORF type:complete len:161 (-),score=11.53 TRINITY_DN2649_c1_g2_i1:364-801(-)
MSVWNKTTGQCIQTIHTTVSVWCLLRLKNKGTFLCGKEDGSIEERTFNGSYNVLGTFKPHKRAIRCLCELSSGLVVSGSIDKMLKVMDMENTTVLHTLTGHTKWIWQVLELQDFTVASTSGDGTVRVWDISSGSCLRFLWGIKAQ